MDMIKVDPKLFSTCRLCLEDLGLYQIVPVVQQQIQYCYNIEVEPYDGLPQLICLKCKDVLNNFFTIKKIICDKQTNLKNRIPQKDAAESLKIQPQQEAVSSSQPVTENSENLEEEPKKKQRGKRVINSSESESSTIPASLPKKKKNTVKTSLENTSKIKEWDELSYKKELVCTICNAKWPQLKSFLNHRRSHLKLKKIFPTIFSKKCTVSLPKIDDKANMTGMNNVVVHNNSKVIKNCNSLFYYIKYSKDIEELCDKVKENFSNGIVDSESTDSEEDVNPRVKRTKRRILSRSSNETVVIESDSNKVVSDNMESKLGITNTPICDISNDQCINIDDSSDSDADRNDLESRGRLKQPFEAKLCDYKIVHGIITMCVNAFHRKNEPVDKSKTDSEVQLTRKVLGIGRKIINGQDFNWTGLLKFLEHKNLDILWITKGIQNGTASNSIRILTKLSTNDTTENSLKWVPVPEPTLPDQVPNENTDTLYASTVQPTVLPPSMDPAVLYFHSPDPKNKLLNANPVANPKQLPRKLLPGTEFRINKVVSEPGTSLNNNEDTELCMPIITSTTSLAVVPSSTEQPSENTPVVNNSSETVAPRIKVKPVSELMSERVLNSLREQSATVSVNNMLQTNNDTSNIMSLNQNTALAPIENTPNIVISPGVWVQPSMPSLYTPHIVPQMTGAGTQMQLVQLSCVNPGNAATTLTIRPQHAMLAPKDTRCQDEYVLLSTVELPNTKTNSPFTYLKNLARIHNFNLIDPHEKLSRDFICLSKFKVQFKQEPIDEPVVLCLSLFCHKKNFCFTVRDRNQKDININKISPNWQWEIFKIFRGELVETLLRNAQRHGLETHENTNNFLCILKSINFSKLP